MIHEFEFRIAYADTDRMGVVYYANYFILFERGRTELLRSLGVRYRDIEEGSELFLPATEASCEYLAPARYDDLLRIRTWVSQLRPVSLLFDYEILNAETGRLLARGQTRHAFVNKEWKLTAPPDSLKNIMKKSVQSPGEKPPPR